MLFWWATFAYAAEPRSEQSVFFDIPRQRADFSLTQFAEQADLTLVFRFRSAKTKTANELVGEFTVADGIETLLADTGLEPVFSDQGLLLSVSDEKSEPEGDRMNTRKKTGFLAALLTVFSAAPSGAQDAAEAVEEIVVVGYRQSLFAARENKRNAEDIRDVLAQEDIGALPSLSIGDALNRLPGLAADRDRGNSSQVSIRGLGPGFGLTTINGREMTTAAPDRDVRLDQFPSELMRGAEVYKTSQADLISGGISGIINLQTIKPLELDRTQVFSGQLLGAYSELDADRAGSNGSGYRGSASYIGQHLDGRLGIAAGIAVRDAETPTNRLINGFFADNRDFNGDGTNDFGPGNFQYRYTYGTDERIGAYGTLQYDLTPELRLTVDALHTDREGIDRRSFLQFNGARAGNAGWDTATSSVDANNVMTHVDYSNLGPVRVQMQDLTQIDESNAFGLNLNWARDDLTVQFDVNTSRTTRDRVLYQPRAQRAVNRVAASFRQNGDASYSLVDVDELGTLDDFLLQNLQLQQTDVEDELSAFKVDVEKSFENTFITSVSGGVRQVSREKSSIFDNDTQGFNVVADPRSLQPYAMDFPYGSLFSGSAGVFPQSWPIFDPIGVFAEGSNSFAFDQESSSDLAASYDVEEDRLAFYIKANFAGILGSVPFSGNVGVRYVDTDVTSRGVAAEVLQVITDPGTGEVVDVIFGAPSPVQLENRFDNALPNLSLNFELTEDLLLRFGASKGIARSPIDSLGATRRLGFNTNTGQATGSGGNPFLEPFESTNLDLSLEYYFADDGLFAVAVFRKDLETVIFPNSNESAVETYDGVDFEITRPVNESVDDGLSGVELQYQQTFTNLPGLWSNLGVAANLTFVDNDIEWTFNPNAQYTVGLEGVSDRLVNAAVYFDDGRFSARLAYNSREEFYRNVGGNRIDDGGEYVDLNLAYAINDSWKIILQGLNLGDEPTVFRHMPTSANATGPYDNVVNAVEYSGRKWFLGVRFSL